MEVEFQGKVAEGIPVTAFLNEDFTGPNRIFLSRSSNTNTITVLKKYEAGRPEIGTDRPIVLWDNPDSIKYGGPNPPPPNPTRIQPGDVVPEDIYLAQTEYGFFVPIRGTNIMDQRNVSKLIYFFIKAKYIEPIRGGGRRRRTRKSRKSRKTRRHSRK